jgi:ABC-type siderophore export system fused ATPase/permease subunit
LIIYQESGEQTAEMQHMFKFSVKISWQTLQLIPAVSVGLWIVRQQSSWMSSQIFSTFSVVLLVLGHPEHSSSSTDTLPVLKHECQSKTET